MNSTLLQKIPLVLLVLLCSCTTLPTGPTVMVLPGRGKNFEQFRYDDTMCQHYALEHIGGAPPSQTASQSGVVSAVTGTAIGAAAGAAIGGHRGAAVGAGTGLLFGTVAGGDAAQRSANYSQEQYDNAYIQCMYANGHLVPMTGTVFRQGADEAPAPTPGNSASPTQVTPPGGAIPPPPPGTPPPPPPGY